MAIRHAPPRRTLNKPTTLAAAAASVVSVLVGTHPRYRCTKIRVENLKALSDCHRGDPTVAAERSDTVLTTDEETSVDLVAYPDDLIAPATGIAFSILLGLCLWAAAAATAWYLL